MRAVIQRVKEASVRVDEKVVGSIGPGYLVYLGIEQGDNEQVMEAFIRKLVHLRLFANSEDKLDYSLKELDYSILLVSQFTLCASISKGRRPDFMQAAKPNLANELYEYTSQLIKNEGIKVEQGVFRASMQVSSINNGPFTLALSNQDLNL